MNLGAATTDERVLRAPNSFLLGRQVLEGLQVRVEGVWCRRRPGRQNGVHPDYLCLEVVEQTPHLVAFAGGFGQESVDATTLPVQHFAG
eukprot:scaffold902_cov242-Pinguiococcus_pyrenoidosus.AAC.7